MSGSTNAGSKSRFSSAGISGSGVVCTFMFSPDRTQQVFTLPSAWSGLGWSSRECAPRLSLRSSALRVIASEISSMFWRSRPRCQPGL